MIPIRRRQEGQAVVILALMAVFLFALAAIAVDLGMSEAERRDIQAYTDNAALAGSRQYLLGGDSNAAHFVALQYITQALGIAMPGSCTVSLCGTDWPNLTGGYHIILTDTGQTLDVALQHNRPTLLAGAFGVRSALVGTSGRALPPGPAVISATYNVAALSSPGFLIDGGGVKSQPSGDVTGNVYSNGPFGANNGPHAISVPTLVAGYDSSGNLVTCPGNANTQVDYGPSGSSDHWAFEPTPDVDPGTPTHTNVPNPLGFDADPPTPPANTYTTLAAAKSGGKFQPGTYNGIVPDGSADLAGGVYKLINVSSPDISAVHQPAGTPQNGNAANAAAVVFVLDSSDSGDLTIGSLVLNGYENSNTSGNNVDPAGTHNYVLYGGPSNAGGGSTGFQGNISSLGPHDAPSVTGIIYMPNSTMGSHGNVSYTFYGAVYMDSYDLRGGGHSVQLFRYICGLNSISAQGAHGGLVR